jgi:hypothetical protein
MATVPGSEHLNYKLPDMSIDSVTFMTYIFIRLLSFFDTTVTFKTKSLLARDIIIFVLRVMTRLLHLFVYFYILMNHPLRDQVLRLNNTNILS